VEKSNIQKEKYLSRRQRQHELLIALINQQEELELMDINATSFDGKYRDHSDPAKWIDRNRRILEKYQALVRSAITLDALLDSEEIQND